MNLGSKRNFTEDQPYVWDRCKYVKQTQWIKHPLTAVAWKLGEGVPAQASTSSSDCALKLRGPSTNITCSASKQAVNIIKLNNWDRNCSSEAAAQNWNSPNIQGVHK
ncbi:hypothetical protein AVEN_275142-1 [Araneus ventricosus]|uniref:Uncharacterized protein n=1 Tax=Araneus ventricosus TaxID=182803 RepID=A0A4Y2LHY7_ARAVE|nr:hypothetical protein AVEN_275142-1 [Araneus ventricosus]